MTDANTICHDLDLLDDWLAGKGYGEEAGLVLRALSLIHKLQDGVRSTIQERDVLSGENFDLRAENEKLRAALKAIMIDAALTTYKDIRTNVCLVGRNVLSDAALLLKEDGDE